MPLFTVELNRIADNIGANNLTIRLHTAAPSNTAPTNGRVTQGGGLYVSGATLSALSISNAADGDIDNDAAIPFGASSAAISNTITHWSAYRGSAPVAFGTLPNTDIALGDSFTINANSLQINGSTS